MGKASKKKKGKDTGAIPDIKTGVSDKTGAGYKSTKIFYSPLFHILLISVIGLIVYSNTFHSAFYYDDVPLIAENNTIKALNNFWPPSGSRYIGMLTFALNYKFHGLAVTGYHIVNLTVHLLNAVLVYFLVLLTLKTPALSQSAAGASRYSSLIPMFSALLFVSHPVQTQAVTYIVQRFTSLATFFYLLSLVCYIKSRLSSSNASRFTFYAFALISAVLAMKTKEISFTLPFVIVLYEIFFFRSPAPDPDMKRLFYLLPFLLTLLIIPLGLTGQGGHIGEIIGEAGEAARETEAISRSSYLFTQFRVIVTYIRLLFLPVNQVLYYDYPVSHSLFKPEVFLSFLFLICIFCLGVYLYRRSRSTSILLRLASFGIFWFFITLSVESSIIPIRDVIYEHRIYLPGIGIVIAFISAVFHCVLRVTASRKVSPAGHYGPFFLLSIIIVILSFSTYKRNAVWKDGISLWEDVIKKSPANERGYHNLGVAYLDKGLSDKALEYFRTALRINPDFAEAHYNLGNVYLEKGLFDEAVEHYLSSIKINPEYFKAHYNLGNAHLKKGLFDKAIENFQMALRLKPDFAETYANLGNAYKNKGMIDTAIENYQAALKINPGLSVAHNNLGNIYKNKGEADKALEHYQIALRINPDNAVTYYNLGIVYRDKGSTDKAIESFKAALRLKPDFTEAKNKLGEVQGKRP